MERNRKNFFLLGVLIVLTLTMFACGTFAFSGCASGAESDGARLRRAGTSAQDERILNFSRVVVTERFLREQNLESAATKPEPVAATVKIPAGALSKFETDPPVILLLLTQIAVRK
ncbi:MAG: hypothetical protein LBR71_05615 [Synergistaceae bacterium]|nr:hypothetical protein [Synergistaceae bacterium]